MDIVKEDDIIALEIMKELNRGKYVDEKRLDTLTKYLARKRKSTIWNGMDFPNGLERAIIKVKAQELINGTRKRKYSK